MNEVLVFVIGGMVGVLVGTAALAVWFYRTIRELKLMFAELSGDCARCPVLLKTLQSSSLLSSRAKIQSSSRVSCRD
jgi:hypothetical protein